MEPTSQVKRRHYSELVREPGRALRPTREDITRRLKEVRSYAAAHVDEMVASLTARLAACSAVTFSFAPDAGRAVEIIKGIAGDRMIAVNRAAVIDNELKKGLVLSACSIVDSYDGRFSACPDNSSDGRATFAASTFDARFESFGRPSDLLGRRSAAIEQEGTKDFVGLLGINAISAEDGSVVLLQHMSNIGRVFERAADIVLVAGIDKIVKNLDDAVFQTKCMAVFGAEALPLPPSPDEKRRDLETILSTMPPGKASGTQLHLILLDNDRMSLLHSEFADFFLCIGCRVCTASCPPYLSGKPLSPRNLVSNLKKYLPQVGPGLLEGESPPFPSGASEAPPDGEIEEDAVWACTTCHACLTVCPLELRHTDAIMGLRRNLAMIATSNRSSRAIRNPLKNVELRGHPWTGINLHREEWTAGLDIAIMADHAQGVDLLYWVGCTPSLDDRGAKVARATASLMKRAGIKFAILGREERCCGEPSRRLGNEYLFELQAKENISMLKRYDVRKIVASCPHCYNMLKNEYPRFGGEYEVIHHTELFDGLFREGRLQVDRGTGKGSEAVTYHDPCCLARDNGVYEPPRQLLRAVAGKVREMDRNRENSFCCGGGGGRIWLEENIGQRISEIRVGEALRTGAGTIATACPFCLLMFEDAIKAKGCELKAVDVAELLEGVVGICEDGRDQSTGTGSV
jgi:Fe-S oxidoreductase